ncbi:hypothetical protein JCM10296v2_007265 [Rhodotorula toruloides]
MWVVFKEFCLPSWNNYRPTSDIFKHSYSTKSGWIPPMSDALAARPSLSILAINHRSTPKISDIFDYLCQTLEHFAYHPSGADNEHNTDMAHCTTVNLPPNLRSFTFVSSAAERYHYLTAVEVGEACRRVGAKFVDIAGRRAKDWDAEEWAYSLMAENRIETSQQYSKRLALPATSHWASARTHLFFPHSRTPLKSLTPRL